MEALIYGFFDKIHKSKLAEKISIIFIFDPLVMSYRHGFLWVYLARWYKKNDGFARVTRFTQKLLGKNSKKITFPKTKVSIFHPFLLLGSEKF